MPTTSDQQNPTPETQTVEPESLLNAKTILTLANQANEKLNVANQPNRTPETQNIADFSEIVNVLEANTSTKISEFIKEFHSPTPASQDVVDARNKSDVNNAITDMLSELSPQKSRMALDKLKSAVPKDDLENIKQGVVRKQQDKCNEYIKENFSDNEKSAIQSACTSNRQDVKGKSPDVRLDEPVLTEKLSQMDVQKLSFVIQLMDKENSSKVLSNIAKQNLELAQEVIHSMPQRSAAQTIARKSEKNIAAQEQATRKSQENPDPISFVQKMRNILTKSSPQKTTHSQSQGNWSQAIGQGYEELKSRRNSSTERGGR